MNNNFSVAMNAIIERIDYLNLSSNTNWDFEGCLRRENAIY